MKPYDLARFTGRRSGAVISLVLVAASCLGVVALDGPSVASASSRSIRPGTATCLYDGETLEEIRVAPPRATTWSAGRTSFAKWQAVLERKSDGGEWRRVSATGFDPPFTRLSGRRFRQLGPAHSFVASLPSDGYLRVRVEVRWTGPKGAVLGRRTALVGDYRGSATRGCLSRKPAPPPPGASPLWWGNADRMSLSSEVTYVEADKGLEPVVGDFDGDGKEDVLWYSAEGDETFWWGSGRTFGEATPSPVLMEGGRMPVVGDFDGDGYHDIYWYGPGTLSESLWWGGPSRTTKDARPDYQTNSVWDQVTSGDFNGDGYDDVYFYRNSNHATACGNTASPAQIYWWGKADRTKLNAGSTAADSSNCYYKWFIGDIDGNGRDDLLAYGISPNTRDSVTFRDEPSEAVTFNQPWGLRPVLGDFDGDGRADIFWFSPSGEDSQWWGPADRDQLLTSHRTSLPIDGDYFPVSGDFDGDGRDDIFWYAK